MALADPEAEAPRGLRARILASAKLSTLNFATTVVVRLASTIILTRLLAPDIYGIFAVVLVYAYLLEMVSDLGLRSLILTYERVPHPGFLRTCWTVSVLRGAAIAAVSALIGLLIWLLDGWGAFAPGSAYVAAEVPWAIAALGLSSLIRSFQTPMLFMAEREMRFARPTALRIAVTVAGLPITIALAVAMQSVWALVAASILTSALQAALSLALFPGLRPGVSLERADLRPIVDRGKWIVGHSTLTALARSADQIVLGLILTSTTFGFYFIARQIIDLVLTFLTSMHAQMDMQVFGEMLRKPVAAFRRDYYRYRLPFDALAGLAAGGLVVAAPLAVSILYDDRYGEVARFMQVLAVGLLLVGPMLSRAVLGAERRFREMTVLGLVSTGTLWIGLGVAVLGLRSVDAALVVIALHQVPEVALLWREGARRGWILPAREAMPLAFALLGAALGALATRLAGLL